jgi:exopolysaccharide production protein ExoY
MSDIDTSAHVDELLAGQVRSGSGLRAYPAVAKRGLDIALVVFVLPVALPLTLLLWLVATIEGGSGFFGHQRVGLGGRPFRCWKIRSMVRNAESILAHHLASDPAAAAEWARDQKLKKDPRVTRFGRFMRRTSLDEIPQLWNVLRGDMSIVGPRPVTAGELDRYGASARFYLQCRPGLTGLWQVNGRGSARYEDRIALDRRYAETMTLGRDLGLILRTVPVVLRRTGT